MIDQVSAQILKTMYAKEKSQGQSLGDGDTHVYLELGGLHGDGDADEEDAEHGDGGVTAPVDGAAVGTARHAPYLLAEVAACVPTAMVAAHHRRRLRFSQIGGEVRCGGERRAVIRADGPTSRWGIGCARGVCTRDPADFSNYVPTLPLGKF